MLDTFFGFVQFVSFVIRLFLDRLLSARGCLQNGLFI